MLPEFAKFSQEEDKMVRRIVRRAQREFRNAGSPRTKRAIWMDLACVHAFCPLRLDALAVADDFQFRHDLFGIYVNLDRIRGRFAAHFLPRFASPEGAARGASA